MWLTSRLEISDSDFCDKESLVQGFNKPGGFVVRACVEKVLTGPFSFTGDMIPGHLPVRLPGHEFLMGLLPGFFPVIKVAPGDSSGK